MMRNAEFETLGLSSDATWDDVKRAFRRLARTYHPDIAGPSGARKFAEITEAYMALKETVSPGPGSIPARRAPRVRADREPGKGESIFKRFWRNFFPIRRCMDEISSNTATSESYVILTWILARQERYSEVIQWGERGLRANTDYRLIETMGEAYFYLKDYERALSFMQRYVNAVPQGSATATAYFFVGEIYHLTRRFFHADIAYTTAVKLNPNNSSWWYRLGLSREGAGERVHAIKAYEQAVKLNPRNQQAHDALERVRHG